MGSLKERYVAIAYKSDKALVVDTLLHVVRTECDNYEAAKHKARIFNRALDAAIVQKTRR